MRRVVRGLFEERPSKEEGKTNDFFDEDALHKIIKLMNQYSIDEHVVWAGRTVKTIPNFLDRLSYQLPHDSIKNYYELSQLIEFFKKSSLNIFLSSIELFAQTLYEECAGLSTHSFLHFGLFVDEFNNLLALKTIPFRIEISNDKIFIDRINSPLEEKNKREVISILKSEKFGESEEHFTNSLINFAKRKYPECVEDAYLTLEKFLKIKVNNHKLDAPDAYSEFKKKYQIERGIFKIHHQKIKGRIDFIYTIRSEIKSHSDKKTFDRKDFLEETAKFQINEVMNIILLLNSFMTRSDVK